MKNGIKIIAALSMVLSSMIGTNMAINSVAARTVTQCGCGSATCNGGCALGSRLRGKRACSSCNTACGCVQCPSCENEICKLELEKGKEKKTCFKVEQKSICIPPVRFPWQKCCPPGTSKTKLVNVLSKHSYECPSCSYKWTLQKPAELPTPAEKKAAASQPTTPMPPIYEVYYSGNENAQQATQQQGIVHPAVRQVSSPR